MTSVRAQARPQGGSVTVGAANIATDANQMTVTTTVSRTAIGWRSFSVDTDNPALPSLPGKTKRRSPSPKGAVGVAIFFRQWYRGAVEASTVTAGAAGSNLAEKPVPHRRGNKLGTFHGNHVAALRKHGQLIARDEACHFTVHGYGTKRVFVSGNEQRRARNVGQ